MKIFEALLFVMIVTSPTLAYALEVDEKLTARVLKTSETRKTLMINRGTEDGLVEGDHAKFIVTAGIVARGVLVKVSPSRSVWSIYRLVNADFIVNDAVMTIKITTPVKVTKDETRSIVQEDTPTRASTDAPLGIPLADGAQDLMTEADADLRAMEDTVATLVEKRFEVLGILNISGLTANSKTTASSFNNSQSSHHIGLGLELYPQNEREWYSHFSLIGSFNFMRLNNQAYNGSSSTNEVTEFSFGSQWHPTKLPSMVHTFIPFFHLSFNLGSVKSTYKPGTEGNGIDETLSANGGTNGYALGFGYKFYTSEGFGARALLDYYMRSEKYKEDSLKNAHTKTVGGPRFMVGISYRF